MTFHHKRKPFPENVTPEKADVKVKPAPVVQKKLTAVGSVFCGWETPRSEYGAVPGVQCPNQFPWDVLQTKDREPSQGYYNEADPAVTIERLKQCEAGGIDCVSYQVEFAHEHTQPKLIPTWRPTLPSPLINAHCIDNHPSDSPVKHFVSWWDTSAGDPLWQEMKLEGWTGSEVVQSHTRFAHEVSKYMTRPNYLTVEGRPVLMRGAPENLEFYEREFGIHPRDITDLWRHVIRDTLGKEIYLIATSVDVGARPKLKEWGFDVLTEYRLEADGWDKTMDAYRQWWATDLKQCREQGLDFWIPATVGFDGSAWGYQNSLPHQPTPSQFTDHIREVRKLAADNYDVTRGFYCIYAMTEFGEGGILEAMKPGMLHDGDEMLVAHKAAL